MMQPLTILIDGYNVSRNMPGSRLEDGVALATARENLLAMVRQRFRGTPYHVAVIFDGAGEREICEPIKGLHGGKSIFTQRGMSADAAIVRLTAEASDEGREVVICTNDLEVRQKATRHGASHASVAEMTRTLNAPDKYTAKRLRHVSHLRHEWESDEDSEPRTHPRKGNPRRAPKKQRGRGERSW
ncbi:MAG TPA: NYN domain-containing protein [Ktedonobacterales bacterium]|nr:NYN domain-containing protein [Ktedonobacterales bacterium]